MALQSQTYANSGTAYYGDPADWSLYPTKNDQILFNGTAATLQVFPAVPDTNTTIAFNGNQLAYVSDIPDVGNWAMFPANHDVEILAPYKLNADVIDVTSGTIDTLFGTTATIPTINGSQILGPSLGMEADQGIPSVVPSQITLQTANGTYGSINLTANPGQGDSLGGNVSITANGGNGIAGLFGAVNIAANSGTDTQTGITTGGKINIVATSGGALTTLTSAISLTAGGINSYAGAVTPIASLAGYNFINGSLGVSLVAGPPASGLQVPGTVYLYGTTGIELGSPTYVSNIYPYWDGTSVPPPLTIQGRTTALGVANVDLRNVDRILMQPTGLGAITDVQTMTMSGAGTITGVNQINGAAYPPPAGIPTQIAQGGGSVVVDASGGITATAAATKNITLATASALPPIISLNDLNNQARLASSGSAAVVEVGSFANAGTINVVSANSADILISNLATQIKITNAGADVGLGLYMNPTQLKFNGVSIAPFVDSFQIYVSPNGNNTTGDGSQQNPLLTIAQAITKRATIAATTEVSIMLSSGTYAGGFTLTRNTYLVGVQTGDVRQPCNIGGTITMSDTLSGAIGLTGLEVNAAITMTGVAGLLFCIFGCNISGGAATAITINSGTLFMSESRVNTSGGLCILSATGITVRDCVLNQTGTNPCIESSGGATSIRQSFINSTSTSTSPAALIRFTNGGASTSEIGFCKIDYTSAATDVGGDKCCIQYAGAGTNTSSVYNNVLLCQGATTGSGGGGGGPIQCIQDTGAGGVTLSYGNLLAGATAHHIAPTITKTALTPVP